ncbi:MAG: TlpA disulfide reductase family protein [Gemmatimonadota bacterium]
MTRTLLRHMSLLALGWIPVSTLSAQVNSPAMVTYRAVVDLAGGPLRFSMSLGADSSRLCNGSHCDRLPAPMVSGDSIHINIPDYAATISAVQRHDSLIGAYHNVGNRGPRVIPFRASRGTWPVEPAPSGLIGRWNATYTQDEKTSRRVLEFRNAPAGLEGTVISNTGDYGLFWGRAEADSFSMGHFDGSFVYMLTGRLDGDTLRGIFHAGIRTQTPWAAVRAGSEPWLKQPTELTSADTSEVFHFSFPDPEGKTWTEKDPRFRNKVVLVDIFGTWCPTCHDAAPVLTRLYDRYHSRGLEIVGLAYEVSGDPAIDGKQVQLYRAKFGIQFPLLIAGINDTEAAAATLPQLQGFVSFPTSIFLGRDGKIRLVHAGFYGPSMGAAHQQLIAEFEKTIETLLAH